jgi:iron complex transport system ATP-binding protein
MSRRHSFRNFWPKTLGSESFPPKVPGSPGLVGCPGLVGGDDGGPVLSAHGVTVRRGTATLLDGVDLAVSPGEVLALVGPNGAGKTTLLAVLSGDERPSAGTVAIHGRAMNEWTPKELALRRAVLPQHSTLSFPFCVRDVVQMGRAPWFGGDDDDQIVFEAMQSVGVTDLAGRPFTSLSGGEQARVALARVLAQRVPVLLLDEPTASLDLHHQELVLTIARNQADRGDAVVVVLHDLGLAAAYADRVAVLAHGRLVAEGPPTTVLTESLLSEVYRHPVEVLAHPHTGATLILPRR